MEVEKKVHSDALQALENGARENDRLKAENQVLAIQARAFDAMANLLSLLVPRHNPPSSVDASWLMRRAAEGLKAAEQKEGEKQADAGGASS